MGTTALVIMTIVAFISTTLLVITLVLRRRKGTTTFIPMIEKIREIGELSFYRLYSKELITDEEQASSQGFFTLVKKLFISEKKVIMMMEFITDFKINLLDPDFHVEISPEDQIATFYLPTIFYTTNFSDIRYLDEKHMKFLPGLIPPVLNPGFKISVKQRNELIVQGKEKIVENMELFLKKNKEDIEKAMENTLRGIAAGFGYYTVRFRPSHSMPHLTGVDTALFDRLMAEG